MATTKIRGITIEIGGDTSGLDKALKNVNGQIATTQKELKDVDKLLKLDPTNTELLAQKQTLLKQRVSDTTEKVEQLKKVQATLDANGIDKNSEQYMALSREITSTEMELKKAKKENDAFNVSLEKTKGAMTQISTKAQAVADKTKVISGVATAVVGALGGLGIKAMTTSDDLNTLAQQTGVSTAELQKFQYASDVVDVSVDTINGALKKMKRNMDSTSTDVQDAWETLGVSVKDAEGNFRDSTEVFYEVLDALGKVENGTERDILAMNIFGKSADELAGIVDDGGKALKEMGDQAEAMGLILSQEVLDSLNATNDEVDTLKATIKGDLLKLGATALQTLTPLIERITEALTKLFNWLGNLTEGQMKAVLIIGTIVASISPIASIIATISGAISSLIPLIATMNAFLLANPIVLVITAIIGAVTALTILIVKNWDTIKAGITKAVQWIKDTFNKVKTWLSDKIFKPIANYFISIINKMIDGINFLIRGLNKIQIKLPDWDILGGIAGKGFGVNIKEIGKIPMLANGGILSQGSAIVGEAGAELLSMVNGKAVVQPLNTNALTSGIVNGLSPFMNSNGNATIQIVLDGQVMAEALYNPLQKVGRQKAVINYG